VGYLEQLRAAQLLAALDEGRKRGQPLKPREGVEALNLPQGWAPEGAKEDEAESQWGSSLIVSNLVSTIVNPPNALRSNQGSWRPSPQWNNCGKVADGTPLEPTQRPPYKRSLEEGQQGGPVPWRRMR